jgi:hypothetical protein
MFRFYLALSIMKYASSASGSSYLYTNEKLTPGQSLISPNGMYSLVFQSDGNVCAYEKDTASGGAYWCTFDLNPYPFEFIMQGDCNLVAYATGLNPYWASGTNSNIYNGCYLTIQDDQNVVIYTGANVPVWSCGCDTASLKDDGFEPDEDDKFEDDDDVLKDDVVKDDDIDICPLDSMSFSTSMEVTGVLSGDLLSSPECLQAYTTALYLILGGLVPQAGISIQSVSPTQPDLTAGSTIQCHHHIPVIPLICTLSDAEAAYTSLVTQTTSVSSEMSTYILQQTAKASGCPLFNSLVSIPQGRIAFSDMTTTSSTGEGGGGEGGSGQSGSTDSNTSGSNVTMPLTALFLSMFAVAVAVVAVRRVLSRRNSHQSLLSSAILLEPISKKDEASTSV